MVIPEMFESISRIRPKKRALASLLSMAIAQLSMTGFDPPTVWGQEMQIYGPKAISAPAGAIILNPGSNIAAIVDAAPTGATFYFEPGVYRGIVIRPKSGQTFIGAQGAVLNGSEVLTNWQQTDGLYVIGGQTQHGYRNATEERRSGYPRAGYPEAVFIGNQPLKAVDLVSKVLPGTFYLDYRADRIYIADNPTRHIVEAGKIAYAFTGIADNVAIQNLTITKYNSPIQKGAIDLTGSGIVIKDNETSLNYGVGLTVEGNNSKIIGNYTHHNGQMGMGGGGGNVLVQGNEIAHNGSWSGVDPLWEGGGFKFGHTNGLVVANNYSHDNYGYGMWTDINNINSTYKNNLVNNNVMGGISHEISYDASIHNNVLIGNGFGDPRGGGWPWGAEIQIQNSQNVDIYNNKIDNTDGGYGNIVLIEQDRGIGTYGPWITTRNRIHNNIIVDQGNIGVSGGVAGYSGAKIFNGTNTWSNNRFYLPDSAGRFTWSNHDYNFSGFEGATSGSRNTISQDYPVTSGWGVIPGGTGDTGRTGDTDDTGGSGDTGDIGTGSSSGDSGTGLGTGTSASTQQL